jgi:RNA polymerase sigma-70 factor (ECF subfamily)
MDNGYRLNVSEMLVMEEVQRNRNSQQLEQVVVELYATLRNPLLSYAYQVACCSGDAEDLVQIAFLKLYDQLRGRAPIENVRSWLYRVVHNAAIDQLRHKGKQESLVTEWLQENCAPSLSAEEDLILRQRVAHSLSLLNERERHCLLLRADGLSYKEISEVLSISAKAVSVYLVRGLKKIGGHNEARA